MTDEPKRVRATQFDVQYPMIDLKTGDYVVLSGMGDELFRSPEKHLAVRFRMQEMKRIGDRRTKAASK